MIGFQARDIHRKAAGVTDPTAGQPDAAFAVETSGGVRVLRINRPERLGAFTWPMIDDWASALVAAQEDPDVRAVVLTGTGRGFCAGRDLKSQAAGISQGDGKMRPLTYDSTYNMFGMTDTDKPIVAAVNGFAIGLGWYMMLDCDIRIAGAGVEFGMTEVPTGALGPYWLAGADGIPWPVAAELAIIGERVPAERLLALNLLNAVVPGEQLMEEAMRWARKLAALPPQHVRQTKALMRQMRALPDAKMFEAERQARLELMELQDSAEAVLAWNERRTPRYTGR
jgi:2-(1,2-epoxy-1,2-dihydrophenyl)acetyl-CoA isomerase